MNFAFVAAAAGDCAGDGAAGAGVGDCTVVAVLAAALAASPAPAPRESMLSLLSRTRFCRQRGRAEREQSCDERARLCACPPAPRLWGDGALAGLQETRSGGTSDCATGVCAPQRRAPHANTCCDTAAVRPRLAAWRRRRRRRATALTSSTSSPASVVVPLPLLALAPSSALWSILLEPHGGGVRRHPRICRVALPARLVAAGPCVLSQPSPLRLREALSPAVVDLHDNQSWKKKIAIGVLPVCQSK